MHTPEINHIKKQIIYLIIFYIFLLSLSNVQWFIRGHHVVLGICQILSISYMVYLIMQLRKIARKKFSLFLLTLAISFIATLIHAAFDIVYPVNITDSDNFYLTISGFENFLPHSLFRYLEGITLFAAFLLMQSIHASKQAKKDIISTGIIALSTVFTLAIGVIELILEKEYGESFQGFHLSLLFQVVYISSISFFIYTPLLRRVLVSGSVFKFYLFNSLSLVVWAIIVTATLLFRSFWIEIPILDNTHFLLLTFLLYGVTLHVTRREQVEFLEHPHLTRTFIYYFVIVLLLSRLLEVFTTTISIYYYIFSIITILALGQRLLYIKRLDEHANHQLGRIAHIDDLTNLENQKKLFSDTQSFINQKIPFTILLVNISRFKQINNLLTYEVGNLLLCEFVETLKQATKKIASTSNIYRHNGDEFMIVIHSQHPEEIKQLCKHIFSNLIVPFEIKNERIKISANIGITSYPNDAHTINDLLRNLNAALKEAKLLPLQQYQFYSKEMAADMEGKLAIEKDLQVSLENGEFELFYQPQYSLDRELVGFEALIRWNHPTKGRVSPLDFIPIAEETGLIVPLGDFVLTEACKQLAEWMHVYDTPIKMSVNVSIRQLQQANFAERVKKIIQSFHIPTHLITLEITETYPFYTEPNLVEQIADLRKIGCKISIDDFGTGFCSLTSLTKVPIDQIKIAREYINTIGTNSKEEQLLEHIFHILDALSFEVVAEGVETVEQLNELRNTKCDYIQGFYFSKPLDSIEATNVFAYSVTTGKILGS